VGPKRLTAETRRRFLDVGGNLTVAANGTINAVGKGYYYGRLIVDNNNVSSDTTSKTLINATVGDLTVVDVILRNNGRLSYDVTSRKVTVYGSWSNGVANANSAAATVTFVGSAAAVRGRQGGRRPVDAPAAGETQAQAPLPAAGGARARDDPREARDRDAAAGGGTADSGGALGGRPGGRRERDGLPGDASGAGDAVFAGGMVAHQGSG